MSELNASRKIIFVGPEQAGKTTMMCGWFHLAKSVYGADPDLEYGQTRQLLATYERYLTASVVDPTSRGEVTRSRFHCCHQHQKFDLDLIDYAGEDISSSANKFLHGNPDEDPLNELEQGFIDDLESADWIIMVHDPKGIAEGSPSQLSGSLWLAKVLPRVLFGGNLGEVSNATVYLSRGDQIDSVVTERAETNLREAMSSSNLAALPIKFGNAKVWESSDASGSQRRFTEFFTLTMLNILNQPNQARGSRTHREPQLSSWKWTSSIGIVIVAALFVWMLQRSPIDSPNREWNTLVAELDQLIEDAEGENDYTKAQSLLTRLDRIESRATSEFSTHAVEISSVIAGLRKTLTSVGEPQGSGQIENAVDELRKLHGPNLAQFYSELKKEAKHCRQETTKWDNEARDEWERIELFCDNVSAGVKVELVNSSFMGPQWWTSYVGNSHVKLEIWVARPGDPTPFDKWTVEMAQLGTDIREPVQSNDQYSVRWPGAVVEQSNEKSLTLSVRTEDQIWVRVLSENFSNGTLVEKQVPREGPLGLDWFDRSQTLTVNNKTYQVFVRLKKDIEVPVAIQKAFDN